MTQNYLVGAQASLGVPSLKLDTSFLNATEDTSKMSPEDLAKLDRPLTPAEQARVDAYQSGQADKAQAVEEQKGGPRATIADVPVAKKTAPGTYRAADTRVTTHASADTRAVTQVPAASVVVHNDVPAWQIGLGALACAAVGYGLYLKERS